MNDNPTLNLTFSNKAQRSLHLLSWRCFSWSNELKKDDFLYVVPDFRLNKVQQLESLLQKDKDKVEFLCNECCFIGCLERKKCYETVSRQNLGEDCLDHVCKAMNSHEGYRFSKAMQNSSFISVEDIQNNYLNK